MQPFPPRPDLEPHPDSEIPHLSFGDPVPWPMAPKTPDRVVLGWIAGILAAIALTVAAVWWLAARLSF